MYWRILAMVVLLVVASYLIGKRPHDVVEQSAPRALVDEETPVDAALAEEPDFEFVETVSFEPITAEMPEPMPAVQQPQDSPHPAEQRHSLDVERESQRIAAAAGVALGAIQIADNLPPQSPMAMTYRRRGCVLLVNATLPLEGLVLKNLSAYGRRQLTFTLGHEIGHCYVLTHVARHDPAILSSLSPPGKAYSFEQYVAMMGDYSEYPDLNRWNEEWADTFSAFILQRVYGSAFATSVTSERFALRKYQERNDSVLASNVYGGHASLAEEALFSIQSPLEIANLVKLGRLNTRR